MIQRPKISEAKAHKLRTECSKLLAEAVTRGKVKDAEAQRKRLAKLDEIISRYGRPIEPTADVPLTVLREGT